MRGANAKHFVGVPIPMTANAFGAQLHRNQPGRTARCESDFWDFCVPVARKVLSFFFHTMTSHWDQLAVPCLDQCVETNIECDVFVVPGLVSKGQWATPPRPTSICGPNLQPVLDVPSNRFRWSPSTLRKGFKNRWHSLKNKRDSGHKWFPLKMWCHKCACAQMLIRNFNASRNYNCPVACLLTHKAHMLLTQVAVNISSAAYCFGWSCPSRPETGETGDRNPLPVGNQNFSQLAEQSREDKGINFWGKPPCESQSWKVSWNFFQTSGTITCYWT